MAPHLTSRWFALLALLLLAGPLRAADYNGKVVGTATAKLDAAGTRTAPFAGRRPRLAATPWPRLTFGSACTGVGICTRLASGQARHTRRAGQGAGVVRHALFGSDHSVRPPAQSCSITLAFGPALQIR